MRYLPLRMFSSGMLMRVLFATATAFPADILLLDEWLSVVDEHFAEKAEKRLQNLLSQSAIVIIAYLAMGRAGMRGGWKPRGR